MLVFFIGYGVLTFHLSSYDDLFHALVMATCIRKERTKLVENFAKVASRWMISGKAVILLWEIVAEIMGVVAEMKDLLCFFPLSRIVRLADAKLFPVKFMLSSGFFPSIEVLESSPRWGCVVRLCLACAQCYQLCMSMATHSSCPGRHFHFIFISCRTPSSLRAFFGRLGEHIRPRLSSPFWAFMGETLYHWVASPLGGSHDKC